MSIQKPMAVYTESERR